MRFPIYLDNNATTAVDPRVVDAMLPYFSADYGNAASIDHDLGDRADAGVATARKQTAEVLGCRAGEIIFTSGATESDNLAIKGVARAYAEKGNHIVTCVTEHKAVLDTCEYLGHNGFSVTYLPVDQYGRIDLDRLAESIRDDTILVSLMTGNNETGLLHPIDRIGEICRSKHVLFHTDATQGFGKIHIDVEEMQIDLLSLSAHKIYGPKGVGALYVRRSGPHVRCEPLVHGGGHERGLRSGTLNVPGIVALGKAAELAADELDREADRLRQLRDRLVEGLQEHLDEVVLHGHPEKRLPNTANLSFAWVENEALILGMEGIAVSSGSACGSAAHERSHVLRAMGVADHTIDSSIRFSLGRFNTAQEIEYTIGCVVEQVNRLRQLSPIDELKQFAKREASKPGPRKFDPESSG